MNNKTSNVNFTSNIRFIPQSGYEKFAQKHGIIKVAEMWDVNQVKTFENKGGTDKIIYCVAGVIKDAGRNTNSLFHWFPKRMFGSERINNIQTREIKEAVDNLSKNNGIKGFAIGGVTKGHSSLFENHLSIKLINLLKKPFKQAKKADFTMFFLQNAKNAEGWQRPQSAFIYHQKTDTYYLNCIKMQNGEWHSLLDKDEIRKHFNYISISPNDKVFIGREQIPNEFLNKRKPLI